MTDGKKVEPLSSDELQSEDDQGGGVTLTPDQAPGHTLPASESGAGPEPSGSGTSTIPISPD